MPARYQAYPEYKESGEEWLGTVPSHWDVVQIKHLSVVKRGASPRPIDDPKYFDEDGAYAWTRMADVTASDVYLTKAPQRLSDLGSSLSVKLEPESLFLSIAGTVGKPCITGMKACIHDGFVYFPELKIPSKFLFYVFAGEQAYKGLGKFGTQLNLNTDTVGGIKIGCTTNDELEGVVQFLDHETAKIDTLIEKQQQLIKLLKEKRQAVISHAVTKGLNPDAPMRDSGVEWLGEVPEHWVTIPLKLVVSTRKGVAFKSVDFCSKGIRVVKASDIKQKTIRATDVFLPKRFEHDYPKALLGAGDIILSTVGSNPEVKNSAVGQIGMVPPSLNGTLLNQNTVVFDPQETVIRREYLFYILQMQGYRDHLDLHAHGTANQSSLSITDMLNFNVCFPDIEEQYEICNYLSRQQQKLGELESKARKSEVLLIERRTALISAAVTGKIDLRNWQAPASLASEAKEAIA